MSHYVCIDFTNPKGLPMREWRAEAHELVAPHYPKICVSRRLSPNGDLMIGRVCYKVEEIDEVRDILISLSPREWNTGDVHIRDHHLLKRKR